MRKLTARERAALSAKISQLLAADHISGNELAKRLGVQQSTVSRAMSRQMVRLSGQIRRISDYVNMRLSDGRIPADAAAAVRRYVSSGGDVDILCEAIDLLGKAQAERRH